MAIEFKVVPEKEMAGFIKTGRSKAPNPIINELASGKAIFIAYADSEDGAKTNSFYEAARRRNMKCTIEKGELDGVMGQLIRFLKQEPTDGNGNTN